MCQCNPLPFAPDLSCLSIYYALIGDEKQVESIIEDVRLNRLEPNLNYVIEQICEFNFAIAYIVFGKHEKAIEILEAALQLDGPGILKRELQLWFIFERLRGNPRFDALLE